MISGCFARFNINGCDGDDIIVDVMGVYLRLYRGDAASLRCLNFDDANLPKFSVLS